MNNEIIEKLKKLVRLGTSDNQNEAEQAMKRAQALAIEHRIDLAVIDAWDTHCKAEEKYEKGVVQSGQRFSVCQRFVNWILNSHFNVGVILCGGRFSGRNIAFIGKQSDIEYAKYLNEYLNETFMRLWHSYKNANNAPTSHRASYLLGLYRGLNEVLEKNAQAAKVAKIDSIRLEKGGETAEKVAQSFELSIVSDREKLQKAVGEFFPKLKRGGKFTVHARQDVIAKGMQDGASINVNRPLGGNRAIKQLAYA